MQSLKVGKSSYSLSPLRNVGEFQAKLAKCDGKYRPTKIKVEKRLYPVFKAGDSTADYVHKFFGMNHAVVWKSPVGTFAPLNSEPCALYSGEDVHEIVEAANDELVLEAAA